MTGTPDPRARGEMPFLDHLEELRWRLVKSLIALALGVVGGYLLVTNVDVISFLKRPIDPYLPDGKRLVFLHPMEPFMLTLKLALVVGVVVALPAILWQVWGFLRPALYQQERRIVLPVAILGVGMFIAGAAVGFYLVMPMAISMMWGFQQQSLTPMITAGQYFGFTTAVALAFGAVFELPLVLGLLVYLRIISAAFLRRHRRTFIILNGIASAFLTPGDIFLMTVIVMVPVQLFYELAIIMAAILERRRAAAAAADNQAPGVPAAGPA